MPRARREQLATPGDIALLAALSQEPNLVRVCQQLGMSRDRGMYRLHRMGAALGAPVVRTTRGGLPSGRTELTPKGRALLRQGVGPLARPGSRESGGARVLEGTFRSDPEPAVVLPDGLRLRVSFPAAEGARVVVAIDPESILVALRRFPTSARNVLSGRVVEVEETSPIRWALRVKARETTLTVAVTPEAVRSLHLRPGSPVVLYLKATAIRPLALAPPRA